MLDETELTVKVDTNLFSLFEKAASVSKGAFISEPQFSYVRLEPSPWGNAIFFLDLDKYGTVEEMKRGIIVSRFPNLVMTGPTTRPRGASALLFGNGFVKTSEITGMTLSLRERNRIILDPDFEIVKVASDRELSEWARIVTSHLFKAEEGKIAHFRAIVESLMDARTTCYLGLYRGSPATTALSFIDDEKIAGYYFVATDPAFRRRGFGSYITSVTLDDLAAKDVEYCILQASEMGRGVYERIGFKAKCALERFSLK